MQNRFSKLVLGVLILNLFIIVWGGLVRATGSGAGCGNHWPACNGEVVPMVGSSKTLIEFTHRITSFLGLLGVIAIFIRSRKCYQKNSSPRKWALRTLVFMLIEALIGAVLVRFGLVEKNDTVARAVVMSIHLVNTSLLIGSMAKLYWITRFEENVDHPLKTRLPSLIGLALIVLSVSGAIAALGDTLFPVQSFLQGFREEFSPTSHILIRLRLYHPFLAIGIGMLSVLIMYKYELEGEVDYMKFFSRLFLGTYCLQLFIGLVNVGLLAPIWIQMVHLLFSNIVWLSFVFWNCTLQKNSS